MESLLKDLPSRNVCNFSHYSQSNYKNVEPKTFVKLKDHTAEQARVIIMDKQSTLRYEIEKVQNSQKRKARASKRQGNENGPTKQSKQQKFDFSELSSESNDRESD